MTYKNIILITASFPYYPGEQFLEKEIKYYKKFKELDLTILPINNHIKKRNIPLNIKLDNFMIENNNKLLFSIIYYLMKSLKYKFFYKEIVFNHLYKLKRIRPFLRSIYTYSKYYDLFDMYFKSKNNLNNTVIYCYWNNEITYVVQSLKKKYNFQVISRIHGYDLYKERRIDQYMPLKKQFTQDIDKIYTVTKSANNYLIENYRFDAEKISLSRLGVEDLNIETKPSNMNTISIVSCSFLIKVKRVDKIINSLVLLSKNSKLNIIWNHIGNGPLEIRLRIYAKEKLSNIENVKYNFLGYLENKKIYKFYKNNKIDVFLNVSRSEGVPVSIMEAMSCHIPIIAPNLGGIFDMINNGRNGFLLSSKCNINEIVNSLLDIEFFKNKKNRNSSYKMFINKYNANENYDGFIKELINID